MGIVLKVMAQHNCTKTVLMIIVRVPGVRRASVMARPISPNAWVIFTVPPPCRGLRIVIITKAIATKLTALPVMLAAGPQMLVVIAASIGPTALPLFHVMPDSDSAPSSSSRGTSSGIIAWNAGLPSELAQPWRNTIAESVYAEVTPL